METKRCIRCKETKPLSEFNKNKNAKDGYTDWCKLCHSEYYKENSEKILKMNQEYKIEHAEEKAIYDAKYRRAHQEETRAYNLQCLYGITLREYDLMLELQDNRCAICGITPEENGNRLFVDHDHKTGEVRGLLCHRCNVALGYFRDSPEICRSAMLYLQGTMED